MESAKSITLVIGYKGGNVSKELKEKSKLTHKYFILMEKAVKRNIEWELIRYPLREGYKKMQEALNLYMNRMIQKDVDDWFPSHVTCRKTWRMQVMRVCSSM